MSAAKNYKELKSVVDNKEDILLEKALPDYLVHAIQWAIENPLDFLVMSGYPLHIKLPDEVEVGDET